MQALLTLNYGKSVSFYSSPPFFYYNLRPVFLFSSIRSSIARITSSEMDIGRSDEQCCDLELAKHLNFSSLSLVSLPSPFFTS